MVEPRRPSLRHTEGDRPGTAGPYRGPKLRRMAVLVGPFLSSLIRAHPNMAEVWRTAAAA